MILSFDWLKNTMYKTEKHKIESNVREPFAKLGNEVTLSPFKEFRQNYVFC